MKKKILSAALIVVMLVSTIVLSSCNNETELEDIAVKVYTLYTVCEEGTTPEAINQVETALNRLTFYELGYCIKLIMTTEDQYNQLINDKLEELAKIKADKTNKKPSTSSEATSETSEEEAKGAEFVNIETGETTYYKEVLTGDAYIDMLAAGYEYVLEKPRLDIFLVQGYDRYISLVGKDALSALDDKLSSEAKLIRDYIYPTFLDAAKVTNAKGTRKTYGVPMNKSIGEYNYIVFDKEYLDKYETDADTMKNLEDLETYLQVISENEPDVVPLSNIFDSPEFAYLFEDGFTAFIREGKYVIDTYSDEKVLEYFTTIARYRAMGYLKSSSEDKDWAVKFVRGTYADIEALEKANGREYSYTVHSYPVATNEDLLETLYCVSSYTISDELTDVSRILEYIETNKSATNLLAYGVLDTHYVLTANNQVKKVSNDYNVKLQNVCNSFISTTLDGENPEKWELLKKQNQDSALTADQSVSVGFAYYPKTVEDPDDKNVIFTEPNYVDILKQVCNEYYPKFLDGTQFKLSFTELKDIIGPIASESLTASIVEKYTTAYDDSVLAEIKADYAEGTSWWDRIMTKDDGAIEKATASYSKTANKRTIRNSVKEQLIKDNPNATDDEINEMLNEICTDEYYAEQIPIIFAKEIATEAKRLTQANADANIKRDYNDFVKSEAYTTGLEAALNSPECIAEKNSVLGDDVFTSHADLCFELMNNYIREQLKGVTAEFYAEAASRIKTAYLEFVDSYIESFPFDDDTKRSDADFLKSIFYVINKDNTAKRAIQTQVRKDILTSWGNPESLTDKQVADLSDQVNEKMADQEFISTVVYEAYMYSKDNTYEYKKATLDLIGVINEKVDLDAIKKMYDDVLLFNFETKIALIKTIKVDTGVAVTEPEEDETEDETEGEETEPKEDVLDDINTVDFFKVVFEKRIQDQYYDYKPLPTA